MKNKANVLPISYKFKYFTNFGNVLCTIGRVCHVESEYMINSFFSLMLIILFHSVSQNILIDSTTNTVLIRNWKFSH